MKLKRQFKGKELKAIETSMARLARRMAARERESQRKHVVPQIGRRGYAGDDLENPYPEGQ